MMYTHFISPLSDLNMCLSAKADLYNMYAAVKPTSIRSSIGEFADDKIHIYIPQTHLPPANIYKITLTIRKPVTRNGILKSLMKCSHITFTLKNGTVPFWPYEYIL